MYVPEWTTGAWPCPSPPPSLPGSRTIRMRSSTLMDLGYRVSTERVEYLKKVEKAGKLNESSMRQVLEGENVLGSAGRSSPCPNPGGAARPGADWPETPLTPASLSCRPLPIMPHPAEQPAPTPRWNTCPGVPHRRAPRSDAPCRGDARPDPSASLPGRSARPGTERGEEGAGAS